MIETIIALAILGFGVLFYFKKGDSSMHDFVVEQSTGIYGKYAPYSFAEIRKKANINK